MNYRDFFQRLVYKLSDPLLRLLLRLGVTPNVVSLCGFAGNAMAAWLFVLAADDHRLVLWGGIVVLLSGLFDMMDGRLARLGGLSSPFGALLDSTLDRYSELLTLSAIALLLLRAGAAWQWAGIATMAAITGSMMVSYVRARAEGLGIACKGGIMQRPERVVVTALAAMATGVTANLAWMAAGMAVMAVVANITALQRILHCKKELSSIGKNN